MSGIDVEHTAREFWATRPRRRTDDRKIAGVAAAIGRRYAIDPVLVRVAFVVATLSGGAGVLLYLAGWLLLPADSDQSPGAQSSTGWLRNTMSAALTIVVVLLLIPITGALLGDHGGAGVVGLAVGVGALLLLHRSRASLGEIPGSSPAAQPATPAGPTPANPADDSGEPGPPAWDPLGAAPFAWDLPEPSTRPVSSTPLHSARSKITPITLGFALLAGGIALAFAPALSATQVAAMLLGVVGLGLTVGSFLHGGRGLILVAIALTLLTWILSAAATSGLTVGSQRWDPPVTAAQVQPHYSVTLGNGDLDLTRLRLRAGERVQTSVSVGVGETHIFLPRDVDAEVRCQTQLGDVYCLDKTDFDGHPSRVSVTEPRPAGTSGGKLVLDVRAGIGQVHVDRASS